MDPLDLEGNLKNSRRHTLVERKRRRRRIMAYIAAGTALSIILGVTAGYFWLLSLESKMQLKPKEKRKIEKVVVEPTGQIVTALLVGTDSRPGLRGSRADTIVFIKADKKEKKAYMVSIPRDSRVDIPGRGLDKINHAWPFGGAPLLIQTVSEHMEMPVNYYFQVDFSQFEQAVDALGGVDFETNTSWYDGELGVQVRAGMQHRNGKEALALIRDRSHGRGSGSDIARVGVQQQFLMSLLAQSVNSYSDVPQVANTIASYVNTNMGMTEIVGLGQAFVGPDLELETSVMPGKTGMIRGVSYVIPDETGKAAVIKAMENNEPLPKI